MNQQTKQGLRPLIAREEIVSRPGAKVIVTRIHLTQAGREALTSGSTGIAAGVSLSDLALHNRRKLEPA